jgi:hypothetical protein
MITDAKLAQYEGQGAVTIDTPLGPVSRDKLGVFLLVFLVGASFALTTNHVWEDFYTAYRSSKNIATGNGLVYNPGERVMTFTSPLNTLTAALFSFLLFNTSDQAVIWLHRVLSLVLLGISAVRSDALMRHVRMTAGRVR